MGSSGKRSVHPGQSREGKWQITLETRAPAEGRGFPHMQGSFLLLSSTTPQTKQALTQGLLSSLRADAGLPEPGGKMGSCEALLRFMLPQITLACGWAEYKHQLSRPLWGR